MKKTICILFFSFSLFISLNAQNTFPEKCLGIWKGTMHIYKNGNITDSVEVKLTVAPLPAPNEWTWKKEYLSEKFDVVKDYILRLEDEENNIYAIDEQNDIILYNYLFEDKLFGNFELNERLFTSSYQLVDDKLIFEISFGDKLEGESKGVSNFSVEGLQKVVFRRI